MLSKTSAVSLYLVLSLIFLTTLPASAASSDTLKIGVLAYRGADHAIKSWRPTAKYLSSRILDARFEVVPLPLKELETATKSGAIDFVFTNSGQYVLLEASYGISRIATLKKTFNNGARNVFGAVIFVRSDRREIQTLGDLSSRSLAAVRRGAFGGFQMAWRELKAIGVNPFSDLSDIKFMGLPQDNIVYAVRDGLADAGTVRTDVLEKMSEEGVINLSNFRVLNRQHSDGIGIAHSTRLYPEWPFAKMPHTSTEIAEKVAIALLSLTDESPEMQTAGYSGWTVPLDYQPVHELFKDLEIGPYVKGDIKLSDLVYQYREWLLFTCIVMILIILHGIRTEYLVNKRTKELQREIHERHQAEQRARRHEGELAHVSRVSVIGEMTSGLAHELRQPLAAIRNYAEGGIRRVDREKINPDEIRKALKEITEQAGRAAKIISRARSYMQKRAPVKTAVDVNMAISEAVHFFDPDAKRNNINISLDLGHDLPTVQADLVEIEQLVINIARNSLEAMSDLSGPKLITIRTSTEGNLVRTDVMDNGPGLNPNNEARMWEPFSTSKEGGLGLGLAICKSIVETYNGKIEARSREGGGTVVSFWLQAGNL
jgi:two-component system sensor histidine kinase TtrS